MNKAALLLADGSRYDGEGLDHAGLALGEAVFYTGMTGYEEALTDPSYAGQILTFTYPMIGNYGISGTASQHPRACVAGAVIKRLARNPSHFDSVTDLGSWLDAQGIPTLVGIDTRALVIALREHGTISAALAVGEEALARAERELAAYARNPTTAGLVASVADTHGGRREHQPGKKRVVVLDCGVKRAIIRNLEELGAEVSVLPYTATKAQIEDEQPDGLVISPGPGDPRELGETVDVLRGMIGEMPMFGICLGHQLLALACGAQTYKLPYGHRGGNQPVKDLVHGEVLVTAHNHGYAVDGATLPSALEATMINLNDGTNEGFRHRSLPVAGVQFHPEASPGPFDARFLFARWFDLLAGR
jgi:carbamoyl-phosphate synthase small subunit